MTVNRLTPLGANKTVLYSRTFQESLRVFYSYDTPVVIESIRDGQWFKTDTKHSVTTSKHINSFIPKGTHTDKITTVPQARLNSWQGHSWGRVTA